MLIFYYSLNIHKKICKARPKCGFIRILQFKELKIFKHKFDSIIISFIFFKTILFNKILLNLINIIVFKIIVKDYMNLIEGIK